jgi:hypothetical protein
MLLFSFVNYELLLLCILIFMHAYCYVYVLLLLLRSVLGICFIVLFGVLLLCKCVL